MKPGSRHRGGEAIKERTTMAQDGHHRNRTTMRTALHSLQSSVPHVIPQPPGEVGVPIPVCTGETEVRESKTGSRSQGTNLWGTLHSARGPAVTAETARLPWGTPPLLGRSSHHSHRVASWTRLRAVNKDDRDWRVWPCSQGAYSHADPRLPRGRSPRQQSNPPACLELSGWM